MQLSDLQQMFNRALLNSFEKTKWLLTFVILALCGLLVVFCRALAEGANAWMGLSLAFFPLFLCSGVLLSLGVVLIRGYHDEIKKGSASYYSIAASSWETLLGGAYFAIPFLLLYLMLWMFLGVFILLRSLPVLGDFFGVILSFAPFIVNFTSLLLSVAVLLMLFFVPPVIALKGLNRSLVAQVIARRLSHDPFSNILQLTVALLPLMVYLALLLGAAFLTGRFCLDCTNSVGTIVEWFFIMIPFAALLSPALIFFFNFAAEAQVLSGKQTKWG